MEKILLIHVLNQTPVPPRSSVFSNVTVPTEKQAQQVLEEKGRYLEKTTGVPVKTILVNGVKGDTAESIIKTANNENISLIVMGARGKSIFRGMFLGSTSKNVIRKAGIDVLVMQFLGLEGKEGTPLEKFCTNIFSHVLCPIDFSIPSEKTLEYVKSMGFIRKVTLLHVLGTAESEHARQQKVKDAELHLAEAKADLAAQIKRTASIILSGNPVVTAIGGGRIERHNLALRNRLYAALQGVPKLRVVSAPPGALASPLLTYQLPAGVESGAFQRRRREKHRIGLNMVPKNWFNGHRVSTHLFNTEQEVDALVDALRAELAP